MSERLNCATCPARDVTEVHIGRCQRTMAARTAAEEHGSQQGIPVVAMADLWAHLGHVGNPEEATRIVRQVVDLGWRPVVGKDAARLWPSTGASDAAVGSSSEQEVGHV